MKILAVLIIGLSVSVQAQTLRLGYDIRHTVDPDHNNRDYYSFSYESYKSSNYGSLLMKLEADLKGHNNNPDKLYTQISHSLNLGRLPVQLYLEYSGGLGLVEETGSGYQISNSYSVGITHAFKLLNSWASTSLSFRYANFDKPSHDAMCSFWWNTTIYKKISMTSYFVLWTVNRNQGNAWTSELSGKQLSGIGEPRIWYNLNERFAVGSEIRLYYHIYSYSEHLLVYPTIAVKYEF